MQKKNREEQKEIQNQKKFKAVTTTGTIIGVSSQQAEKLKESSKSSISTISFPHLADKIAA